MLSMSAINSGACVFKIVTLWKSINQSIQSMIKQGQSNVVYILNYINFVYYNCYFQLFPVEELEESFNFMQVGKNPDLQNVIIIILIERCIC